LKHFGGSRDFRPLWKPSTWRRRPLALVVDDDPDIQELLRVALSTFFECRVEVADSVAMAIDKLESRCFSFVVCDLLLGKGTGLDVFYFLRRHPEKATPFILFSGNSSSLLPFERDRITAVNKSDLNRLLDVIEGMGFTPV
jgi:CheY-like chemotaxis protein